MKLLFTSSMSAFLLLSGCASIEAGDQVKDLQEATSSFADALKAADSQSANSFEGWKREQYRTAMLSGEKVSFETSCLDEVTSAQSHLLAAIDGSSYDRNAADSAYRELQTVKLCDSPSVWPPRLPSPVAEPSDFRLGPVMATDSKSLSGTARQLEAYVKALADVATGETAGKTDEARHRLVTSGLGLLGAVGIGGADPFVNAASAAIDGIIAAKRNDATRRFLGEMDEYMPTMMERIGLAARIAHTGAAVNRARASRTVAAWANRRLNTPDMYLRQGKLRFASEERIALYDQTVSRLATHNAVLRNVASSDPMAPARAFAEAHHALTEVYRDPKASRRSLVEGLAHFQEAATALREALKEASEEQSES